MVESYSVPKKPDEALKDALILNEPDENFVVLVLLNKRRMRNSLPSKSSQVMFNGWTG